MMVDENSGCIDGFPKLGLACDHFQICKFSEPQDPNFGLVCGEIAKIVNEGPRRVQSRLNCMSILFDLESSKLTAAVILSIFNRAKLLM